jgi:tetratricopeptide (TPR) repeat protein
MKTALIAALLVAASLVFPINGVAQTATEFNDRGVAKWRKGDLDGAIADYNRAVELDPKYAAAYYNRGVAKWQKGDLDGAFGDCNRAVELDPKDAKAYDNRAIVKQTKGDLDGAIADYNRAVELNPKDTAAYYNRGVAKQTRGDLDGAFADYNRTLELDPKYAKAYNERGLVKQAKGDADGAIADYNRALEVDPKYAVAYNNRSAAKQAKGDLSLDDRVAASQQRITSQMKDLSQIARSLSGREATLVVQIVAGTPFCEIDCLRKLLLIRSFVHNEDDKKKIDVEISDQIDFLAQAADVEIEDIPQKTPVLQDQAAIQAANKLKDELRELKKLPKPVP